MCPPKTTNRKEPMKNLQAAIDNLRRGLADLRTEIEWLTIESAAVTADLAPAETDQKEPANA